MESKLSKPFVFNPSPAASTAGESDSLLDFSINSNAISNTTPNVPYLYPEWVKSQDGVYYRIEDIRSLKLIFLGEEFYSIKAQVRDFPLGIPLMDVDNLSKAHSLVEALTNAMRQPLESAVISMRDLKDSL